MFDLLQKAVDSAISSGAAYSDARILNSKSRSISARNGDVEDFNQSESIGIGIRALVGSSWGFYSTYDLSHKSLVNAGIKAHSIAKASAKVPGKEFPLADVPIVEDEYTTPHEKNPFKVSSSDQINLLVKSTEEMKKNGSSHASGRLDFWDTEKWFFSSQGHKIYQNIVESGGGISSLS
ncbi:MAG: DNA gyrase modulator, partial [Actinomycetota bacterium]|nr:DNA gyrase modulator [Actinomycetota bacterium]